MTLPEADTTPLAMAAQLLHEVQRIIDLITCGTARKPWSEQSTESKDRQLRQVDQVWGKSFPEFYEYFCTPYRLMGDQPPAEITDENHEFVRHARMLHSVVHGVLDTRVHAASPTDEVGEA
ncbi:hypothetical protein [Streptomyces alfalfae]